MQELADPALSLSERSAIALSVAPRATLQGNDLKNLIQSGFQGALLADCGFKCDGFTGPLRGAVVAWREWPPCVWTISPRCLYA